MVRRAVEGSRVRRERMPRLFILLEVWGFILRIIRCPRAFLSRGKAIILGKLCFKEYRTSRRQNISSEDLHNVYQNSSDAHSVFPLAGHVIAAVVFLTSYPEMDLPRSPGHLAWSIVYLSSSFSSVLWTPRPPDAAAPGSRK